jgi:hypothetical protein
MTLFLEVLSCPETNEHGCSNAKNALAGGSVGTTAAESARKNSTLNPMLEDTPENLKVN